MPFGRPLGSARRPRSSGLSSGTAFGRVLLLLQKVRYLQHEFLEFDRFRDVAGAPSGQRLLLAPLQRVGCQGDHLDARGGRVSFELASDRETINAGKL